MYWEPGEIPCSFVATYTLDRPLLPIMHELNSNVTFTFGTLKSNNTAFVSQIYSGSVQSETFDESIVYPYEKIQPNMVEFNLPVKDVDNMPPVFTNNRNEEIYFLTFHTSIDSCKQDGIDIDFQVFDGDLFLDEEIKTKLRLFNLLSEVPLVHSSFKEAKFYCTDLMRDNHYILAIEATQVSNPLIRKNTLKVLLSLQHEALAKISGESENVTDWKVVCSSNCYIVNTDETIKLQFEVTSENTVLLSKTPGLLVDHNGYVLVTEEFIYLKNTDKLTLLACLVDPVSRKVTVTEKLTTDIDLSSIDIGGFVHAYPSNEKLYIGLIFGLVIPLIIVLVALMIRYRR